MDRERLTRAVLLVALVVLTLPAGGCPFLRREQPQATVELILYFPDNQAQYLVPEPRRVEPRGRTYEEMALQGLIAGPRATSLIASLPEGTRLLGVEVRDGVARADFSAELQARHPGGSAGETLTVYSIVNTLTERREIRAVLILIEGREQETLAGHLDLSQPLERDEDLIRE